MKDSEAILAFKVNDTLKIHEVIRQYSPLLFSVSYNILSILGTKQDIEECVSDVFIYLWQNPSSFNSEKGNLKSYLCLIAKSKSLDCYRRLAKTNHLHIPIEHIDLNAFSNLMEVDCDYTRLYDSLEQLTSKEKDILIRRYFEDEKPEEIAQDLGVSSKSIINNLYRSKAKLKKLINIGGKL